MNSWIDPNSQWTYNPITPTYPSQPRNVTGPIYYSDNSGNGNPLQNQAQYMAQKFAGSVPAWFVNSEEEALSRHLDPGDKAIFMDISQPYLYVRVISPDGVPEPVTRLRYMDDPKPQPKEVQAIDTSEFLKREDFEKFKKEIEELLK